MFSPRISKLDYKATASIVTAVLFWSLAAIFVKLLSKYLDPWTQNMFRYLTASLFWLPFLIWQIRTGKTKRNLWKLAIVPAMANVLNQSCWAQTLYYIDPAFANLLVQSSIIWVSVLSILLFVDERALAGSRVFWTGLILSMAGVVGVLVFKDDFSSKTVLKGIILGLSTAFGWGLYTISIRRFFKNVDSRNGFAVTSIYTTIGLAILAMRFGNVGQITEIGVRPWIYIIVSAVMCIGLSHVLYYAAIRRIGATIPALVMLSVPFVTLAVSGVIFNESLNVFQWIFGIILLTGSGLAIWAQQYIKRSNPTEINK